MLFDPAIDPSLSLFINLAGKAAAAQVGIALLRLSRGWSNELPTIDQSVRIFWVLLLGGVRNIWKGGKVGVIDFADGLQKLLVV